MASSLRCTCSAQLHYTALPYPRKAPSRRLKALGGGSRGDAAHQHEPTGQGRQQRRPLLRTGCGFTQQHPAHLPSLRLYTEGRPGRVMEEKRTVRGQQGGGDRTGRLARVTAGRGTSGAGRPAGSREQARAGGPLGARREPLEGATLSSRRSRRRRSRRRRRESRWGRGCCLSCRRRRSRRRRPGRRGRRRRRASGSLREEVDDRGRGWGEWGARACSGRHPTAARRRQQQGGRARAALSSPPMAQARGRRRRPNTDPAAGSLVGPPLVCAYCRSSGGTGCCASSRICTSWRAMRPLEAVKKE